ncbi:hypothetical protein MRX96_009895 [Rhipicephalus microplus]
MVRVKHISKHAFISDACRHHQPHEAAAEGAAGSEDSTWFGSSILASTLSSPTHVDTAKLHEAAEEGAAGSEDSKRFGPSISASILSSPTHADTTSPMRQQQKALKAPKIPRRSGQAYQLARFHL